MKFSRTDAGRAAKYLFYSDPVLWVEGHDDIPFYETMLDGESFHIQVSGGRLASERLAQVLAEQDLPFVVVTDGDYSILSSGRARHRRSQALGRYSWENYLFEEFVIERVARKLARVGPGIEEDVTDFRQAKKQLESGLFRLVALDYASQENGAGVSGFPESVEALLLGGKNKFQIDPGLLASCEEKYAGLPVKHVRRGEERVSDYSKRSTLLYLVRGHLLFSAACWLVRNACRESGVKSRSRGLGNNPLLVLMVEVLFGVPIKRLPKDLQSIRGRIRKALRESRQMMK